MVTQKSPLWVCGECTMLFIWGRLAPNGEQRGRIGALVALDTYESLSCVVGGRQLWIKLQLELFKVDTCRIPRCVRCGVAHISSLRNESNNP